MPRKKAAKARASDRVLLGAPVDVEKLMRPLVANLRQESFWVIGVDARNRVIDKTMTALGTLTGVEVHPREVFRAAIEMSAAGIVVCHNHPSGDPTPSQEDIQLTKRLRTAGVLLGIPVLDHVVVADEGYRSIAEWLGTEFDND